MKHDTRMRLLAMSQTPFNDQPLIDRRKLGQMVNGYISKALVTTPDVFGTSPNKSLRESHSRDTIRECDLAQMIRDCVHFYWRNRVDLEWLYRIESVNEYEVGQMLWLSRNELPDGFDKYGGFDSCWDTLHKSAVGFGPVNLMTDEHDQVTHVWTLP